MSTFGHKLRHERESRNTRIQDVAARTHIGLRYLEALENNDFDALPGPRGFGKLYIRAYAEVLGFDPKSLIDAFEEERRKQSKDGEEEPPPKRARIKRIHYVPPPRKFAGTTASTAASPEAPLAAAAEKAVEPEVILESETSVELESVAEPTPEPEVTAQARETTVTKRPPGWAIAAMLGALAVLAVAAVTWLPKSGSQPPPAETIADNAIEPVSQEPSAPATTANELAAAPVEQPAMDSSPDMITADGLRVSEFGVGGDIVDKRLVDRGTRFEEGSTVAFFTRVLGGGPGKSLHHVWLREGRVVQTRELRVASANWRTYSTKTLWGTGNWSVEARGADGRVLARAEFSCVAP